MNEYRRTNTTASLIHYHFIFCPRYRRKIFLHTDVEERFKQLVHEICMALDIVIVALEYDKDYTLLFLNALSTLSPADIMAKIKGVTSKKLNSLIFSTCQASGHILILYLLQEMYRTKPLNAMLNNKKQGG